MEFILDEEHEAFRRSVRDFARREVTPDVIDECERERRPPLELFKRIAAQGWLESGLPGEDGEHQDLLSFALLLIELAKAYVPLADLCYRCVVHGGATIGKHGTAEMKAEFLPRIARGELFFVNGITEPETGADAASVSTRAVEDGDHYVINGTKTFNTGMLFSDYVVCYVRTDPDAEKHAGITAVLVPVDAPGITVSPLRTVGYRTMVTSEVHYDDVRVPRSNVLGDVGGGWKVMVSHLDTERFGLCCICTGASMRVVELSTEYANARHQFGVPIGNFQAIQHMIADMAIAVHGGALITMDLARRITEGASTRKESAIAKAYTARMYKEAADSGLQIFGAHGYIEESEINRHWRDARLHLIGGGSIQIMRNIIARQVGVKQATA